VKLIRLIGLGLTAVLMVMGCSSGPGGGEGVVFAVHTGFLQGSTNTTVDVVDIGVPWDLYNVTAHSVRLRAVSLVSVPGAVHVLNVYAHQGMGVGIIEGDLLKLCRQYPPYPLTDVLVPPHSDSTWKVVLAITFIKPGRYQLGRVKIYYTTNGHQGWQYQNLNTIIYVKAARQGTKPEFSGCP